MKKTLFTLALFTVCGSASYGNTIQLSAQGASDYHAGLIQDDLVLLKDATVEFLSSQIKCDSINIKFKIDEGSLFQGNKYVIQGTASCPGVVMGEIKVQIDSGGSGSKMILILQTENQQVITKIFKAASIGE